MALNDDEYFKQQPSFHAWIGYALGMFDVVIDDHSPLMKSTYTYGLGVSDSAHPVFNIRSFEKMSKQHQNVMDEAQKKINLLNS